jgi:hypothetical protein
MYATGHSTPSIDKINSYSGSFVVDPDTQFVTFTTYRELDTGNPQDAFVIQLNQRMKMCFAFLPDIYEVVFHKKNYGLFVMEIGSDGSI